MTGDELRDIWLPLGSRGYKRAEVDELLGRVATKLDSGHPVSPQIKTASFRSSYVLKGYDVDAVDWLLAELLHSEEPQDGEPAGSADAWHDLPVVNLLSRRDDVGVAQPQDADSLAHSPRKRPARLQRLLAEHCASAWRAFEHVPGARLVFASRRHGGDLHAAGQQVLASVQGRPAPKKITVRGRIITFTPARKEPELLPVTEQIAKRGHRDCYGHFCANPRKLSRRPRSLLSSVEVAVDEDGTPVLYTSGIHEDHCAYSRISFPGERSLRFPVLGTSPADAIMTAVDETGKRVARYRCVDEATEIAVHPSRQLTEEMTLAIAASALWVRRYFLTTG